MVVSRLVVRRIAPVALPAMRSVVRLMVRDNGILIRVRQ
jgi:hypothetical protein